jgi:hypothetical protein
MFVEGEPALLLSSGDRAWRQLVADAGISGQSAVSLRFVVSSWLRGWNTFDLDNLIDPVIAAVAGPVAQSSVWATVDVGDVPGVFIGTAMPPPSPADSIRFHVSDPPRGSVRTTTVLPEREGAEVLGSDEPIGCSLVLGADTTGIVFGFNGSIKPTIDALWPVLGGAAHRPADHRVRDL